jgi:hypothetical protein
MNEPLRLKPNQRMSLNYQKLTRLFSLLAESYRNAETFLKHTPGEAVSHECIRSQVQRQGSNILKEEKHFFDTQIEDALKPDTISTPIIPSSEILYLEVDGTMIHLPCEKKKKAGLKLAILHKGKEKRYPHGATDAKKLKEKIAYTGLLPGE